MKKIFKKIINTVNKITEKTKVVLSTALVTISTGLATVSGYATKVNLKKVENPEELMGGIMLQLCTVAQYVGLGLLAFGLFQLFMAFKDEDAGSKSRAMLLVGVGIVLGGLKTALTTMGILV